MFLFTFLGLPLFWSFNTFPIRPSNGLPVDVVFLILSISPSSPLMNLRYSILSDSSNQSCIPGNSLPPPFIWNMALDHFQSSALFTIFALTGFLSMYLPATHRYSFLSTMHEKYRFCHSLPLLPYF